MLKDTTNARDWLITAEILARENGLDIIAADAAEALQALDG